MFRSRQSRDCDRVREFRDISRSVGARLTLPTQPVDATPSNQLIRQCFPREPICLAVLSQNLNRVVFPFGSMLANRRVSTSLRPVVMEFSEFFHLC